jgi:DNA transformation protein and related proteins
MDDAGHVQDLFASFGPVDVRRMFGGAGVFADGLMFALIVRGVIYLKADEGLVPAFEREGSQPFSYTSGKGKQTRRVVMSYWRLPERLYDEPEELAEWARDALAVARRAGHKPAARARKRKVRASAP